MISTPVCVFWCIVCSVVSFLFGTLIGSLAEGRAYEKRAISRGYGSYYRDGQFYWKCDDEYRISEDV